MAALRVDCSSADAFGILYAATTWSYAAVSASTASVKRSLRSTSTAPASVSRARSSSDPVRVLGSPATIIRREAPIADARAAADPPPGVGSDELNAVSRSRTDRSMSGISRFPANRVYGENGIRQRNGEAEIKQRGEADGSTGVAKRRTAPPFG